MDWVVIGTLATIVAATATAIQAWVVWKQHQLDKAERLWEQHRLAEAERLKKFTASLRPDPTLTTLAFPTTYSPPPVPSSGVVLVSEVGADYTKLRDLLEARKYKEADEETRQKVLYVARKEKEGRLDSKAIENFPCQDLRTIDQLWVQNSNGRFGFSVQKEIYNQLGKDYGKFADQVEWRTGKKWKSYEQLMFEMRAPKGHLPTSPRVYVSLQTGLRGWSSPGYLLFPRIETCTM